MACSCLLVNRPAGMCVNRWNAIGINLRWQAARRGRNVLTLRHERPAVRRSPGSAAANSSSGEGKCPSKSDVTRSTVRLVAATDSCWPVT